MNPELVSFTDSGMEVDLETYLKTERGEQFLRSIGWSFSKQAGYAVPEKEKAVHHE